MPNLVRGARIDPVVDSTLCYHSRQLSPRLTEHFASQTRNPAARHPSVSACVGLSGWA